MLVEDFADLFIQAVFEANLFGHFPTEALGKHGRTVGFDHLVGKQPLDTSVAM
jgi:hypothetical protein